RSAGASLLLLVRHRAHRSVRRLRDVAQAAPAEGRHARRVRRLSADLTRRLRMGATPGRGHDGDPGNAGEIPMTTVVERFPRNVRCLDPVFITMSDGTRLAATIWLPEDAQEKPVPAILELIPYRR